MKIKYLYSIVLLSLITLTSCKTRKYVHNFNSEFITLKFLDQHRFKYFYYKSTFTEIVHNYCAGRYLQSGRYYVLYPDSINQNKFEVRYWQQKIANVGKNIKLRVETDITDGALDLRKYKITVFNKSFNLMVNDVKIDTLLKDIKLNNFKIKIDLREDYTKMYPLPTFTSVVTKNIKMDDTSNSILIKIPVTLDLFYYKFEKQINLEDAGKYWIINNNKILKNDTYPIQ